MVVPAQLRAAPALEAVSQEQPIFYFQDSLPVAGVEEISA